MMAKDILKAVHETAKGLHKAGTMDAMTMREFDALCLPPVKRYTPAQIRRCYRGNPATSGKIERGWNRIWRHHDSMES